ncbi:MAG: hypothetical protein L3J69_18330 [Desulfobacula sp.]|nr:hypothetical protein [Desulfobacula sp.]
MNDILAKKVSDNKYHQSLKYLSHLLKGEKRNALILDIAQIDIFLASQCVMSSETNKHLETQLSEIAFLFSKRTSKARVFNLFFAW